MTLRLVIFDVDGTLVDSQADILGSMDAAFSAVNLPTPSRAEVLGIVGLSLPLAMSQLAREQDETSLRKMVDAYKDRYVQLRRENGAASSPLYDGMRELLVRLNSDDNTLLGIATGKSRRGLNALLDTLDLRPYFVTTHCADDHPSKPNPSMLRANMRDVGIEADQSVMIGDTSFDMDMAKAANMRCIGVTWGYHTPDRLSGATRVVHDAMELETAISTVLGDVS